MGSGKKRRGPRKDRMLVVRVPSEIVDELDEKARESKVTRSQAARNVLELGILHDDDTSQEDPPC